MSNKHALWLNRVLKRMSVAQWKRSFMFLRIYFITGAYYSLDFSWTYLFLCKKEMQPVTENPFTYQNYIKGMLFMVVKP